MCCSKTIWALLLLGCLPLSLSAQKAPIKFGKIDPADLAITDCAFEPGAAAMVLCDFGEGDFEIQGNRGFVFTLSRHKRIKILTKTGLDQANVNLVYYAGKSGDFEKITDIKAACYFLENGEVKTQTLSSKEVYTNEIGHGVRQVKFAIPGAREGCVIEYVYQLNSQDITTPEDWFFQEEMPALHSEYRLSVPDFFVFQNVLRGGLSLSINRQSSMSRSYSGMLNGDFNRTEPIHIDAVAATYQWAMDQVPSIHQEPFSPTMKDFAAHMECQLLRYQFSGGEAHDIMPTYDKFNSSLLEQDEFGNMAKPGSFEKQLVADITASEFSPEGKARAILRHIQQKIKWNDVPGIYADQSASKLYNSGAGDDAEINLFLVACLRAAGLKADPVILGTRSHGLPHPIYPKADKFNFVVAAIDLEGKTVLADATSAALPLGYVDTDCLHGDGWRVSKETPGWIPLQANASGGQTTLVQIARAGDTWSGKATFKATGYAAAAAVQKIQADGTAEYFKSLSESLNDWNPGEPHLTQPDDAFSTLTEIPIHRDLDGTDILYLKPVLAGSILENPYTAESRVWPIDFPYTTNFNYVLTLTVPDGYNVAEKPADAAATFGPEKDLLFQFRCSQTGNVVTIISKLQMKRGFFLPNEYPDLRKFYDLIVQKNQEMLVLKKT